MRNQILAAGISSVLSISSVLFAQEEMVPPPVEPSQTEAEILAREHIVRLEAARAEGVSLIQEGINRLKEGRPEEAITMIKEGRAKLPNIPKASDDFKRASKALSDAHIAVAEVALKEREFDKATLAAKAAAEEDPTSKIPTRLISQIESEKSKPPPEPPVAALDKTTEFLERKAQIRRLFREGKILLNSQQFQEAEKRFQQVLLLDRDNEHAHIMINEVYKQRRKVADTMADMRRNERLWQVTDGWYPIIPGSVKPPEPATDIVISQEAEKTAVIRRKLNEIIIPEISIINGVIQDVVLFLRQQSKAHDPEKIGINIVMGGGLPAMAPTVPETPVDVPVGGEEKPADAPAPVTDSGRRITVQLNNVPLGDALRFITNLAGLKYVIESSAVLVVPIDYVQPMEMVTRVYLVSGTAFRERVQIAPAGGAGGAGGGGGEFSGMGMGGPVAAPATIDVKAFFESSGVPFPAGATLTFNEQTSRIIVKNTPENLEIFEQVLKIINIIPSQVEIETKFIEISQADLDELGFDWKVGHKILGSFDAEGGSPANLFPPGTGVNDANSDSITGGLRDSTIIQANAIEALLAGAGFGSIGDVRNNLATFRGVLTNPQFEVIVKALSQKRSTDLLSAPRITTISGAQAQIRIVQEFIYPTEFDPPEVVAAGGGTFGGGAVGITPSNPSGFRTREIGVLLNVTPQVGADGYTINLTVIPEVSEFLGFINYGGPIALAAGGNVVTAQNDIRQPLFASRNLTTTVVIWDGQTVVLGGLIREDISKIHDKVPFLGDIPIIGRLFQSKVTQRSKRNLLIFVTARLIKPDGQLLNPPETGGIFGPVPLPAEAPSTKPGNGSGQPPTEAPTTPLSPFAF